MSIETAVDPATQAFLGSLIADAVAMPVHWYYDQAARVVDPVRQAADVRPMRNRKIRESSLPSISRWNRFAKASTKKRFKISQRL
jgi:hypothetical protein